RREHRREPTLPRAAVPAPEPVREEQLEVLVRAAPEVVVERLLVVRVGAVLEQQPCELELVLVRRLVRRVLPVAERAGEGGERRRAPAAEEAGVRVRAALEQQPRDLQGRARPRA